MAKISYVVKRSGATVPFNPERITNAIYRAAVAVGGRDKDKAAQLSAKVVEYLESNCSADYTPQIEEIQDAVEKVLIENGHAKVAKNFILYREERAQKRRADSKFASRIDENVPWQKIWHVLDWSVSKGLNTIKKLNDRIELGEFAHIVHESENAYEEDILTASEMIQERLDQIKMVMISGPSSSGKTTTTLKLEQKLQQMGMKFRALIVDNYFFDLEFHPKDEFGDYDFETPQALDLELINDHLKRLSEGEEVGIPYYDFKTGTRTLDHTKMKLEKNEILLIDSLHGLHPEFSKAIPSENKFLLYLEPLLQMKDNDGEFIRWTDIRLMRRMLRDSVQRAYNPQQTLEHWHYVRSSELRSIIPYQGTADYIINSAMPYELPLYAHRLRDNFNKWVKEYEGNPLREDAYERAVRISKLLNSLIAIEDDSPVPHDSVIREFIAGSSFDYH